MLRIPNGKEHSDRDIFPIAVPPGAAGVRSSTPNGPAQIDVVVVRDGATNSTHSATEQRTSQWISAGDDSRSRSDTCAEQAAGSRTIAPTIAAAGKRQTNRQQDK